MGFVGKPRPKDATLPLPCTLRTGSTAVQCDVTNTTDVDALVAATTASARAAGGLHAIVNNAGIRCGHVFTVGPPSPLLVGHHDVTSHHPAPPPSHDGCVGAWLLACSVPSLGLPWVSCTVYLWLVQPQRVMDVNFFAGVRITKALLPLLMETKGRVVNVTSTCGFIANPQVRPRWGVEAPACSRVHRLALAFLVADVCLHRQQVRVHGFLGQPAAGDEGVWCEGVHHSGGSWPARKSVLALVAEPARLTVGTTCAPHHQPGWFHTPILRKGLEDGIHRCWALASPVEKARYGQAWLDEYGVKALMQCTLQCREPFVASRSLA